MSVYLHRTADPDLGIVVAMYEVRLLSSGGVGSDLVKISDDIVFKNPDEFTGRGWRKFVSVKELRSGSFIQDDTIKLRVQLTTKNCKRIADF